MLRKVFAQILILVFTLSNAAYASHENESGFHWEGDSVRAIKIIDRTGYNWSIQVVLRAWERSGMVKLSRAKGRVIRCGFYRDDDASYNNSFVPTITPTLGTVTACRSFPRDGSWAWWEWDEDLHTTMGVVGIAARNVGVFCHELGHTLGLEHRTDSTSCMRHGGPGSNRPDGHDLEAVAALHAHSD